MGSEVRGRSHFISYVGTVIIGAESAKTRQRFKDTRHGPDLGPRGNSVGLMNRTFKCIFCGGMLFVFPRIEVFELMEDRRLKPHIDQERPVSSQPVGRTVLANMASATATGAGFPVGSFTGPDQPRFPNPRHMQAAMANDNMGTWRPLLAGPGFPIGAFTGPDRPRLGKPHCMQAIVANDNLGSWIPPADPLKKS
jgi:hypothetical protein